MAEDPQASLSTLFEDWLSNDRVDREFELDAFLNGQPEPLRAPLRRMIEDYLILRDAVEEKPKEN